MNLLELRLFLEQMLKYSDRTVVLMVNTVHANVILVKTSNGRCFEIELKEVLDKVGMATSAPTAD